MNVVVIILLVFAFVLFALRAVGVTHPKYELTALGLAFWVLATLLGAIGGLGAR